MFLFTPLLSGKEVKGGERQEEKRKKTRDVIVDMIGNKDIYTKLSKNEVER